jgi:hypothetical protein
VSTSTYLQLCKDTQAACEISGTSITSVSGQSGILSDLTRWVADADVAIQREANNWDFLYKDTYSESTVAGTASYNKPSDLGIWDRKTFYLDRTTANYVQLREVEYRTWFNSLGLGTQTNRQPTQFVINPSKNLILHSPPDAVYTLTANYWCAPVRMTADGDFSLIPEAFIRCIIAKAKMYYAISQEATEVYQEAFAEYSDVLSQLKSDQLPGWEGYRTSDDVQMTVSTDGYTGDGQAHHSDYFGS